MADVSRHLHQAVPLAQAADSYTQLLNRLGPSLSQQERDDANGTQQMVDALRKAPAQTVSSEASFVVPTRRNAINTIEAPITVADGWNTGF